MPELEQDDKVIEPETKPEDKQDDVEPLVEPSPEPEPDVQKVHPLQPGGKRFEQIYAQSKQTQRDLEVERALRIAAETKLAQATTPQPTANALVEYTWPQLEQFIAEGKISRADAQAHREEVLTRNLSTKLRTDFTKETTTVARVQALDRAVGEYLAVAPDVTVVGSPDRNRLDTEFDWLASVAGVDAATLTEMQRKTLQLTALRNVYGPIDALVKRTTTPRVERTEGLPGGMQPRTSSNPDQKILDSLTKSQVEHYNKMFRAGRYPGKWKDVVAELKYVRPTRMK